MILLRFVSFIYHTPNIPRIFPKSTDSYTKAFVTNCSYYIVIQKPPWYTTYPFNHLPTPLYEPPPVPSTPISTTKPRFTPCPKLSTTSRTSINRSSWWFNPSLVYPPQIPIKTRHIESWRQFGIHYTHPTIPTIPIHPQPSRFWLNLPTSGTTTNGLLHQTTPSNILFIICININHLISNLIQILNNSTYIIFPINKFSPVFFQNEIQIVETLKTKLQQLHIYSFSQK